MTERVETWVISMTRDLPVYFPDGGVGEQSDPSPSYIEDFVGTQDEVIARVRFLNQQRPALHYYFTSSPKTDSSTEQRVGGRHE